MTINITRDGVIDALTFAWMLFVAVFLYVGVVHLETISKCLVIQTEIMVKSTAPRQPSIMDLLQSPPEDPQAPSDQTLRTGA